MKLKRLIPCLLLRDNGLVKTVKFRNSVYVGDPINTIRIFNEKEVDELVFLDIDATKKEKDPPYDIIRKISSECFMPFSYGGGIKSLSHIEKVIGSGAEKVIINSQAFLDRNFVRDAVKHFGSSTIVVSVDVKKDIFKGNIVYIKGGAISTGKKPLEYVKEIESAGAGEILLNSIDRDGTMTGYDIDLIRSISKAIKVPLVACGGAGSLNDLKTVITEGGASAAGAGSFFVFHGKRRAVLITYPSHSEIINLFS